MGKHCLLFIPYISRMTLSKIQDQRI